MFLKEIEMFMNMGGYRMIMITHVFVIYMYMIICLHIDINICYEIGIMTLYTICILCFLII